MRQLFQAFCEIDDGATAIEYALLATMVAIGAFAAIVNLGDVLKMLFDVVETGVSNSI